MKVLLQEERFAMYPEIIKLMKIAMTVPLSTAWPERGFSTLKRVKSFMRNRLLNALMQISLNGPHVLSDEQANAIAEKWLVEKRRLKVTTRGMKGMLAYEEKMKNQKMKVQESKAEDDEDLDFVDSTENDANMAVELDDTDIIDGASTTFWM